MALHDLDKELFLFDYNNSSEVNFKYSIARNKFTNEIISYLKYYEKLKLEWTEEFLIENYSNIYSFIDFFIRHKGKYESFYKILPYIKFKAYGTNSSGNTNLFIYKANNKLQNIGTHIFIKSPEIFSAKILDINSELGNKDEIILNSPLDFQVEDNSEIYLLNLARFNSDSLKLTYVKENLINIQLSFQTLQN